MVIQNIASRRVFIGDGGKKREAFLTHKEFEILRVLGEGRDKAWTRKDLLSEVWKHPKGAPIDTRTVDQHMARLRQKLGKDGASCIKTLPNFGYCATSGLVIEGQEGSITFRVLEFSHTMGKKPWTKAVIAFDRLVPLIAKGNRLKTVR